MCAGGVNAVAGGGTVFSFAALAGVGVPLVTANATNAFALVPGSLGSVFAYRDDLRDQRTLVVLLLIPTVLGSLAGAWVVANTPEAIFRQVVPFLILFAALLFAFSKRINAFVRQKAESRQQKLDEASTHPIIQSSNYQLPITNQLPPVGLAFASIAQFVISLYGGYFGAGIGILMLSSFSLVGMTHIHRMNGLKVALATAINGTAVVFFALSGRVNWPLGIWMAIGALVGGYVMARISKRINQDYLRAFVVVMGIVAAVFMFARAL